MAKTHVSILHEYCTKLSQIPHYDLIVNQVGTHNPCFKYRVTVEDIVSYGEGTSKKEAKHEAAKNAIIEIESRRVLQPEKKGLGTRSGPIPDLNLENVATPHQKVVKKNTVGGLSTFCSNNRLPLPSYELIGEEGPPHLRTFTVECHVGHIQETAQARTKQQAKHIASQQMIERLKPVVHDNFKFNNADNEQETDDLNEKVEGVSISSKSNNKQTPVNCNLYLKDFHVLSLKDLIGSNSHLDELRDYKLNDGANSCDSTKLLEQLFEGSDISVSYIFIASNNKKTEDSLCYCEISSEPNLVSFGGGKTDSEAKQEAAHMMLNILKDFL